MGKTPDRGQGNVLGLVTTGEAGEVSPSVSVPGAWCPHPQNGGKELAGVAVGGLSQATPAWLRGLGLQVQTVGHLASLAMGASPRDLFHKKTNDCVTFWLEGGSIISGKLGLPHPPSPGDQTSSLHVGDHGLAAPAPEASVGTPHVSLGRSSSSPGRISDHAPDLCLKPCILIRSPDGSHAGKV